MTKTITAQHIVQRIKAEAEKKYPRRLSVLARRLRWNRAKLWRVLTGEQVLKLNEFLSLCEALKLPPSELV